MAESIINFVYGYLTLLISGKNIERFLNLCHNRNIHIWNCKCENDIYIINMRVNDFRKIKPLVRKSHVKIRISDKHGIRFIAFKKRKHMCFLAGIILFCILIFQMSQYIWNISLDGGYTYTEGEITSFLNKNNIYHGIKKNKIDCDEIERLIRNEYFDITWVSAELNGTCLIIHIKENFDNLKDTEQNRPRNLTAVKAAIIKKIITREGNPLVKEGDTVKKGDILVSGTIDVLGDDKEIVKSYNVCADADVYGQVEYKYNKKFSLKYTHKMYTGNVKERKFFQLASLRMSFCLPDKSKNYDKISNGKQLCIFDNFYLPIYWGNEQSIEYTCNEAMYTEAEAMKIADNRLEKFLEKMQQKGIQIISNDVKIDIGNNQCYAKGKIIAIEPIATGSEIATGGNDN